MESGDGKKTSTTSIVLTVLLLGGIGWCTVSRTESNPGPTSVTEQPRIRKTLQAATLCAPEQDDLRRAAGAGKLQDWAGLSKLIDTQKIFELVKGTDVTPVGDDGQLVKVWIDTGVHSGSICWTTRNQLP